MDHLSDKQKFDPILILAVPNALLVLLMALNLSKPWRAIFMAGLSWATYLGFNSTTGLIQVDYILGCMLAQQWLTSFQLLFLMVITKSRHRTDKVDPMSYPLWYRIYWCFCLMGSSREIGWSHAHKHLRVSYPSPSRRNFLIMRLWRVVACGLYLDVAHIFMSRHSEIFTSQATIRMSSQPFTWRCICLFGMYTVSISVISMFYNTLSLLAVGSGLSSPMGWPDCFGSITDAYTISTFWGNLWHQMLSRHVIGYGRAAARGFGFQRGSVLYYVVLLVVGFGVSGLLHCGGDAMFGLRRLGSSLFIFQIQAFGIALEQSVIYTAKRLNWTIPGGRAIGFCWVIVWFYFTASEFMSAQIETGVADEGFLPFSPIGLLLSACGVSV